MSRYDGVIATRRFGLGARPGDIAAIGGDSRDYLLAQLSKPEAALLRDAALRPSHEVIADFMRARLADQELRKGRPPKGRPPGAPAPEPQPQAGQQMAPMAGMSANGMDRTPASPAAEGPFPAMTRTGPAAGKAKRPLTNRGQIRRDVWQAEIEARVHHATTTDAAFLERLVMFWSNHFAVAARKSGLVRVTAGAFEREAIRPHVLGRFADMALAVEKHPAMLFYLDNFNSVGPNSKAGRRRAKGLNENLAREMLELHTVGVDAGYTQTDVTNLARILTGWTVPGLKQNRFEPGKFAFTPARHEPGAWTVLGKSYPDRGIASGEQVIADLARHPATARHIARKFAAHFVANPPPPGLVAKLEKTFRDTDGDLGQLARALFTHDEAWNLPPKKLLPPYDFLIASLRAFATPVPARAVAHLSAALGQPIWNPPSPKGWPEDDDVWMAPSSIRERLRIAGQFAAPAAAKADPVARARDLLAGAITPAEMQAIARAESRLQGTEILMMSPSFQRR
ncbi:MAG: DUF1800 domain-containing protein [Hyphomicrobiaceae bacterium]